MNNPTLSYHRQLILLRDLNGRPFAFFPLLCRLYTVDERIASHMLSSDDCLLADVSNFPDILIEYEEAIAHNRVDSLLRKHTPGIALIVTQNCNLGCSYCLAKQGTFGLAIEKMKVGEVFRRIEGLFKVQPDIDFIKFFGGEPTLEMDLINNICDFVTNQLSKNVHFALTTNGTFDAEEHIDTWKKYHISVSVSIDGPQEIHDEVRTFASGKGSHADAIAYCDVLRNHKFPFAAVGVFDERHINGGFSYLDTIKYLNSISPLSKVQFVETLGDAVGTDTLRNIRLDQVPMQVNEAVDKIMDTIKSSFVGWEHGPWLYDNNLLRFIYGIVNGKARPYKHACTASHLTTLFPSGKAMACYALSDKPNLNYGNSETSSAELMAKQEDFLAQYNWEALSEGGVNVPWWRGVVGDICVADMMNSSHENLRQSDFYSTFQKSAVERILKHLACIQNEPMAFARLLHAIEKHRVLTGKYTAKMGWSGDVAVPAIAN